MEKPECPFVAAMAASLDAVYHPERLAACDALLSCAKYVPDDVIDRVGEVLLAALDENAPGELMLRERALTLLARYVNHCGW